MKAMPHITAQTIYKLKYWDKIGGDQIIDQQVATIFFDGHVNHGTTGIKLMQEVLGVPQDRVVGPITLQAINSQAPAQLFNRYRARRRRFYIWLANQKPQMRDRWLGPWLRRIDAFAYRGASGTSTDIPTQPGQPAGGGGALASLTLVGFAVATYFLFRG